MIDNGARDDNEVSKQSPICDDYENHGENGDYDYEKQSPSIF